MKILSVLVGLFVFIPTALYAIDPLAFKLKGIGVGTAKSEMSELLRTGKKSTELSVDSAGIEVFEIADDSSAPGKITITFLDGKAVQIVGEYSKAEVERVGGLESIFERLTERLGPPPGASQFLEGSKLPT